MAPDPDFGCGVVYEIDAAGGHTVGATETRPALGRLSQFGSPWLLPLSYGQDSFGADEDEAAGGNMACDLPGVIFRNSVSRQSASRNRASAVAFANILREALRERMGQITRRLFGPAVSWRRIVAILP
jgi:hypothetical protein